MKKGPVREWFDALLFATIGERPEDDGEVKQVIDCIT